MKFKKDLIAPCGINCGTCIGFLREKNKCDGCLILNAKQPGYCNTCKIRNCEKSKKGHFIYCFACNIFPCYRLKQLDKRYRERYHLSLIENLLDVKENGIKDFLKRENEKWICKNCGANLSVHRDMCTECKEKYR